MNFRKLEEILKERKQPKFRLGQIMKAVYQDGVSDFAEISNLPKSLREVLEKEIKILSFSVEKVLVSTEKNSIKALLKLEGGNLIETVLISPKPDIWSACISSQNGCPLGCKFCATGGGGFKRNLTAEEIADQVLFWKQYLKINSGSKSPLNGFLEPVGRLTNIVYMGMGEPFLNWDPVKESLEILTDKKYFNFGSRSISVSTAGISEGIGNLAKDFPQINLAISLHFAKDEKRSRFMPINKKYNLVALKKALDEYFEKCNRKVFLEYILFDKINDQESDTNDLASYIKSFKKHNLLHVNLIRYNETSDKFKHSSFEQTQKFKNWLLVKSINCTIRKSLGQDIQGACGQLAGQ